MKQRINPELVTQINSARQRLDNFKLIQPPRMHYSSQVEKLFGMVADEQVVIRYKVRDNTGVIRRVLPQVTWDAFFQQADTDNYRYPDGADIGIDINKFHIRWWWQIPSGTIEDYENVLIFVFTNMTGVSGVDTDMRLRFRLNAITDASNLSIIEF